MGHITSAFVAIVLGVTVLVAYFYGTNKLLDFLIPNYDDRNPPKDTVAGSKIGRYSLPDVLVLVLGLALGIAFFIMPWLSMETDSGNVNIGGYSLSSLGGDEFSKFDVEDIDSEDSYMSIVIIPALESAFGTDDIFSLDSDMVNDLVEIGQNTHMINRLFQLIILAAILTGLWGIVDSSRQRVAALVAVHVGLVGILYYVFLNFQLSEHGYSFFEIAGFGNLLAVLAIIGLFIQPFLPRPAIADYNHSISLREGARPWLFVGPALLILTLYLVYPAIQTTILSFYNSNGDKFVGLRNYRWALNDSEFWQAVRNNILWLLVVPFSSTALGLLIAVLADRVRWGAIAKSFIFMPMAISFVGASVIWKFVYDIRPEGIEQIGILNAIVTALGGSPHAWVATPGWNNFFLMIILIWIQTGFAMVLMSAALRGVPEETLEAASIDGASEVQIFFRIMIPQIMGTIAVVMTTITIVVLKVFDIVLAMTNGQWDSEVLANMMYDWMFRGGADFGRGSMLAMVIMIAVIPVMVWNIRRFQQEEALR